MPPRRRKPRRGVVLGGGGVLGGAWMVGALCALEEVCGFDPRSAEMIVGTSAGSVIATMLGAGVSATQLRDHQQGRVLDSGPLAGFTWDYEFATGSARPPIPRPGMSAPAMVARNVLRLHEMPPTAVLAAFLPTGTRSLERLRQLVEAVSPVGAWSPNPGVRVVAMDLDSGRRVVFGEPGAPQVDLAGAVLASCSIPGWFAPVTIAGDRYVDGGACSATSVDVLAGKGLDEVYVLAPMVSFEHDRPGSVLARLERRWRVQVTKRCIAEADKLRHSGTTVHVIGPGAADLEAIGANSMDVTRRLSVLASSQLTAAAAWREIVPAVERPARRVRAVKVS